MLIIKWGGMSDYHPAYNQEKFMKFFKKPNGMVYKVMPNHDIESLKARFEECDANGNAIKKEKPKAKAKKKAGK